MLLIKTEGLAESSTGMVDQIDFFLRDPAFIEDKFFNFATTFGFRVKQHEYTVCTLETERAKAKGELKTALPMIDKYVKMEYNKGTARYFTACVRVCGVFMRNRQKAYLMTKHFYEARPLYIPLEDVIGVYDDIDVMIRKETTND